MRINTNLSALNAYRNLAMTDNRLSKSLERLSSGLRINRAADDAAGLAISEKMRGQIRGLNQAMRNAMDGISLMQTAEGALNETHAILQRMRELSVQASSDTLTSSDRIEIQREIEQLVGEIDRIASSTEFNTKKLLDGSSAALTSTSELNTKIFMRGGLRTIDQFGQKAVGGGNYQLDISATAGLGEVQKTDIMKIKHEGPVTGEVTTLTQGVEGGDAAFAIDFTDMDVANGAGFFRLSFDIDGTTRETGIIAYDSASANMRTAMGTAMVAAGISADDFLIAGSDLTDTTITFRAGLAATPIELNMVRNNLTDSVGDGDNATYDIAAFAGGTNTAGNGSFRLTFVFDGVTYTSGLIDYDFNGGEVATALAAAHSQFTAADFTVDFGASTEAWEGFEIEFTGNLRNTPITAMAITVNTVVDDSGPPGVAMASSVTVGDAGAVGTTGVDILPYIESVGVEATPTNEVQRVSLNGATGGTFTLTHAVVERQTLSLDGNQSGQFRLGDGTTEVVLNATASTATIQSALENLYGEGHVSVSDGANLTEFDSSFTAGVGASGLQFTDGGDGGLNILSNQISGWQGDPSDLGLTEAQTYATETTAGIEWDASAIDIQGILEGLGTIGPGNVLVGGVDGGPWEISFIGTLGDSDQQSLIIDHSSLTGAAGIGSVATLNSAIYDIDRFWDANGNFLVQDPKTINLVQGDGKKTSITIFGSDTIQDIQDKLNHAIHQGLKQVDFNPEENSYVQYVTADDADTEGFFTVTGTFVIQSAVTGKDGEIRFSGDEGVINALSLTTLQRSQENQFNVTVTDAHDPTKVIAENTRIVGNLLVGVVHENVDVKFNPMAGVYVEIPDGGRSFNWQSRTEADSIFIHLSDNTMVFHIGANPLQDVGAAIGDMSAEALGIDNILVTNRESANRAISQLDYAIGRVSSERAKMGALQNRLEHTINNLGVAAENLSAAESRVRDLDFALEMVEFTRNQIMMQAGTSMLAQANMKPQSVLMLLQ